MSKINMVLGALKKSSGTDLRDDIKKGLKAGAEVRFRKIKARGIKVDDKCLQRETIETINNKKFMSAMREQGISLIEVTTAIKEAYDTISKETT